MNNDVPTTLFMIMIIMIIIIVIVTAHEFIWT